MIVHLNSASNGAPTAPPACKGKGKRSDVTPFRRSSPLTKRIAQSDLPQVAQSWQTLCVKSGGKRDPNNDPCVVLAGQKGIAALLANADTCAQQVNADAMVDFAKSPGINNKQALIDNAIAYRKHPRNALNINGITPSTLFCQKAPRNAELKGVVNAQLQGVDPGLFGSPNTGIVAFGAREFFFVFVLSLFVFPRGRLKYEDSDWVTDPSSHSRYLPLWQEGRRGNLLLPLSTHVLRRGPAIRQRSEQSKNNNCRHW